MIIDAHLDTALWLREHQSLCSLADIHCDFERLHKYVDIAFFAIFIHPQRYAACQIGEMMNILAKLSEDIKNHEHLVKMLLYKEQLLTKGNKILVGAEGGGFLAGDKALLSLFYTLGLRFLGLTWNYDNHLSAACGQNGGLTALGKQVVRQCNDLGILLDAAHISSRGFWELLAESQSPIIVSHAACSACHEHIRNLDDKQLTALGKNHGVIGITFVKDFLSDKEAGIEEIVRHIIHAVEVAGIDAVGIGSDFDGADPAGLRGVEDLPLLWSALAEAGFNGDEIDKIRGGNFYRVLQEVLAEKENF
ncbi:MAG: dipeptidase [Bacillota bacterium]|jgi:membrane dipeptidase